MCLRAENVAIGLPGSVHRSSPRNELDELDDLVTAVIDDGPVTRIDLDAGFRLSAYVTRPIVEELGLPPGRHRFDQGCGGAPHPPRQLRDGPAAEYVMPRAAGSVNLAV